MRSGAVEIFQFHVGLSAQPLQEGGSDQAPAGFRRRNGLSKRSVDTEIDKRSRHGGWMGGRAGGGRNLKTTTLRLPGYGVSRHIGCVTVFCGGGIERNTYIIFIFPGVGCAPRPQTHPNS